jgi:pimeloyl-ACP methyl ester carboxylesterase
MKTIRVRLASVSLAAIVMIVAPLLAAAGEPAAIASGFVETEGGRIYYEEAGEGPAVVMIHDGLLHRVTWDGQFAAFAESHRVIRWDRRGYGRSDPPTAPFRNIDDLYSLMEELGIETAALVGCSSGGLLAIEYALAHPDRVSALVLVGPIVSGFSFSEHFKTRGGRGMPDQNAPAAERIDYWADTDPWIMAPESAAARSRMRAVLTSNPQNLNGSGRYARWPGFRCLDRLSEIEVPTLLVAGESDIPDVHAHVGAIEAGVADARRVVLPHCGHLAHMEAPEAFNRLVLDFLQPAS